MLSFCLAVTFCCYRFIFFNLLSDFLSLLLQRRKKRQGCDQQQFEMYQFLHLHSVVRITSMICSVFVFPPGGKIILLSLWSFMRGGDGASSTNLKRWKVQLVPFSFLAWWYIWSVFSYCEISLAKAPATREFTGLKKVHLQSSSPRTTLKQNSSYLATFLFSLIRITIKYQDSAATEETLDDALGHKYSALLLLWLFSSAT